jgi:hypothetical protein
MYIIKDMKDDEKEVHSKALLLTETSESLLAAAAEPLPRAVAAFVMPEAVLPTTNNVADDFEVAIRVCI